MVTKSFFLFCLWALVISHAAAQDADSLTAVPDTVQDESKVKALNELFRANLHTDPVKALGYTREALNLATEIGDEKGKAASYNNLGVAYRNQGALDKALEYYMTSLKIYTTLDNKEGIATTKNNISNIYSLKKDYDQAMRYLEESFALLKEVGDQEKIIGSMNNLGNLYSDNKMYEKARKYYADAYTLSQKIGKQFTDPLTNIGNMYFRQGDYQVAIEYYQKALEMERQKNDKLGILNTISNVGAAFTKAKQPKPARQYLDEALQLSNELQTYALLPTIYKALAENAYNQEKYKDAYEMRLRYDEAREKIHGEESSRNIAQMEMLMDFQDKERQIDMLKKEDEIKTLELRNSRLFIIMIILGILIIIAVFNLFYLDRKRKLVTP